MLPEEPREDIDMFKTLSSKHSTYQYASDQKMAAEQFNSGSKNSEMLSNFISETDQSHLKSNEILNYLLFDLNEFLDKFN